MVSRYVAPFHIIVSFLVAQPWGRDVVRPQNWNIHAGWSMPVQYSDLWTWCGYAGWSMPVQYSDLSIANSCLHTRSRASIFVSHMLQLYHWGTPLLYTLIVTVLTVDGWREPAGRNEHSTAVVDNQLYLWGGDQYRMPEVHDSAEKRQFFSSVEVFDVNTGCWEQRTTRGTPPLGVGPLNNRGWGTNAEASLWNGALHWWRGGPLVCGGRAGWCCPIITTTWSTVSTRWIWWYEYQWTTHFLSVHKWVILCCLSIVLLVVSSLVLRSNPFLIMRERADNSCTCISCLSLISSPDGWSSPVVTGQAPPLCSSFTLTTVGEKKAAMFGGFIQSSYSDDLYIVDLKRHSVVSV